jgi:hypothetical protein
VSKKVQHFSEICDFAYNVCHLLPVLLIVNHQLLLDDSLDHFLLVQHQLEQLVLWPQMSVLHLVLGDRQY